MILRRPMADGACNEEAGLTDTPPRAYVTFSDVFPYSRHEHA